MKTIFCSVADHQDNPLNLICMNPDCWYKGLICSFCMLNDHQDHVKLVYPLKTVIQHLNRANNPRQQEHLQAKGLEIFGTHDRIKQAFKSNLNTIKQLIAKLEKELDSQIRKLHISADLFVGDAFEKSIQTLNKESLTKQAIDSAIEKISPLLHCYNGSIYILRDNEINEQSYKLIKTAEILERESKYWLEKCIEDLQKLEATFLISIENKISQIVSSQKRYAIDNDQWNLQETDAIAFKSQFKNDIWLSGVGIYEITSYPENQLHMQVTVFDGKHLKKDKIIHQESIPINETDHFDSNIGRYQLNKALKIQPDHFYVIALKPSEGCLSYYGTNLVSTKDFVYEDAEFTNQYSDNSTNVNQGVIPVLYYEV